MSNEKVNQAAITKADAMHFVDQVKGITVFGTDLDISTICLACQHMRAYPFICQQEQNLGEVSKKYEQVTNPDKSLINICSKFISNPPPEPLPLKELIQKHLANR